MENGCDIRKQYPSPKYDEEVNRKYDIDSSVPVFLFVGQHIWQKNVKLVIEAIKELKISGAKFHMLFVGDGPNRKEMENMVADFGLGEYVTFAGRSMTGMLFQKYILGAALCCFRRFMTRTLL